MKRQILGFCLIVVTFTVCSLLPEGCGKDSSSQVAKMSDIEIGTPTTNPPTVITLVRGLPLGVQEFEFNPATHEVGLAHNSPNLQQIYGNTLIDATKYGSDDFNFADLLTTDRAYIGHIAISCANGRLIISPNYIVSPAERRSITSHQSDYCVQVDLIPEQDLMAALAKGGTTMSCRRNEERPTTSKPGMTLPTIAFSNINQKSDVITWTIKQGGVVTHTGSFGFPVVGTEPGLVKYFIRVP